MPSAFPATIVVLEENAAVQELIDQALRESGHRVLSTKDVLEALEVVRRVRIDVLVVGDPRKAGDPTFLSELRSLQPGLRIVGICGSGDDLEDVDPGARLSSPFSLDDLREAVEACADQLGRSMT